MESRVQSGEVALKSSSAELLNCLNAPTLATEKQLAGIPKHLLVTSGSKQTKRLDRLRQVLCPLILKVLEVAAVLDLAFVPEDKVGWALH